MSSNVTENGFSRIEAVLCLLYVVGMWIIVYIVGDFVNAWKRVKDAHIGFGGMQHFIFQDIYVFDVFIFHQVGEAFFLHTSHI